MAARASSSYTDWRYVNFVTLGRSTSCTVVQILWNCMSILKKLGNLSSDILEDSIRLQHELAPDESAESHESQIILNAVTLRAVTFLWNVSISAISPSNMISYNENSLSFCTSLKSFSRELSWLRFILKASPQVPNTISKTEVVGLCVSPSNPAELLRHSLPFISGFNVFFPIYKWSDDLLHSAVAGWIMHFRLPGSGYQSITDSWPNQSGNSCNTEFSGRNTQELSPPC